MGLDMYLTKRTYVQNWDYMKESQKNRVSVKGADEKHIKPERVQYVIEQLCYWRKANHIHKWFVNNVQNGVDDGEEYIVSLPEIKQLMDVCYEVMTDNSKAQELLPTSDGFFFGNTNYDEFYFTQTLNTYKILKEIVEELEEYSTPLNNTAWMEYRASW
jgi:hypothetical protein